LYTSKDTTPFLESKENYLNYERKFKPYTRRKTQSFLVVRPNDKLLIKSLNLSNLAKNGYLANGTR